MKMYVFMAVSLGDEGAKPVAFFIVPMEELNSDFIPIQMLMK